MPNALAIAVARHLIQDGRDPRRYLVNLYLIWVLERLAPKLVFGKNGRGLSDPERMIVVCRHMISLCEGDDSDKSNQRDLARLVHQSGSVKFH